MVIVHCVLRTAYRLLTSDLGLPTTDTQGSFIMKKISIVLFFLFLLPGCMKAIEMATGLELTKHLNPVMELEMDLVFLDEIAAFTKLNQIILERTPISLDDPWPELLNHYAKTPPEKEEKAREQYEACLETLLKDDFYFFRTYNTALYFNMMGATSTAAMLAKAIITARDLLVIEAAKGMGIRFEHAKWVLSYYPFGCKCDYYSREFGSLRRGSAACRKIRTKKNCPFFNLPTEQMLYQYLFSKGGLKSWEDLQIDIDCMHIVEGESLGSFREVFYTLLPDHLRSQIRTVDNEVNDAVADLASTQARLKEKGLKDTEEQALEKREEVLQKQIQNRSAIQDKLYKEAVSTLEVTPEKVRKAKKLLQVTQFISYNFSQISAAMSALTIKLTDDMMAFSSFGQSQITGSMVYLATQGVASGSNAAARKRAELLGKRFISLPVNYVQIWSYAISQKSEVSTFMSYLEALAEMGNKL